MTEQEIQACFDQGLAFPEGRFQPLFYLARVDEPEFGCEGHPDQGQVYGRAYGRDADGPRQWDVEETALWQGGFDDGMWVGLWQGGYATLARRAEQPVPLSEELFHRAFGA